MIDVKPMTQYEIMRRWPRLTAHVISESLGYASPELAALIVKDAKLGKQNWCEWLAACWRGDAKALLKQTIRSRHHHRGFMAWYPQALELVKDSARKNQPITVFGSWS